ncbi:MAG: nucleotidyltransferase domain-containing protein [Methanomassiliicoccaceae archaeon]|nr:nucleotidyltransferase domain-containing protein [Methanomassiliicoccaceae archaeon]
MTTADEIKEIQDIILATVPALQIYLFGSHAMGTQRADSDYDIYVVIPDGTLRPLDATRKVSAALRSARKRPIDLLVGSESKFNKYKDVYSIEKEVFTNGLKLYG